VSVYTGVEYGLMLTLEMLMTLIHFIGSTANLRP